MSERLPDEAFAARILELVGAAGPGKTIDPAEVAKSLRPDDWRPLLKPVRRAADELAREGRLGIYRKGKPVDPDRAKGVIRLGPPRSG